MKHRFRVEFLEEAKLFLDNLDEKTRTKIVYNIWKARSSNDKELLKNLKAKYGNLEQSITKRTIDFLLFGIKKIRLILLLYLLMG